MTPLWRNSSRIHASVIAPGTDGSADAITGVEKIAVPSPEPFYIAPLAPLHAPRPPLTARAVSPLSRIVNPNPSTSLSGAVKQEGLPDAEAVLMQRVKTGDMAAFGELYDRLAGPLFSVALHVLQNREEAEEVLQEVFLKIWKQAGAYDPSRGAPFHWAATVTRHKAIDRLRALGRRARLHENSGADAQVNENPVPAASELAASEEAGRAMRIVLNKLSSEQHEALDLAYFSGLTQTEIAEKLGQPLGTVKARIRRGLFKLRDLLAGKP